MSRESKILQAKVLDPQQTIYHYESFGWELLSLNGKQITMTRETQNPVYADLVKHQAKYEELEAKYAAVRNPEPPKRPAPFSLGTCLLLLILAVLPGALYIAYKVYKNKLFKEAVATYQAQLKAANDKRAAILAEMESVALESRGIFFSRQN